MELLRGPQRWVLAGRPREGPKFQRPPIHLFLDLTAATNNIRGGQSKKNKNPVDYELAI